MLCDESGLSQSFLSDIIRSDATNPREATAKRIIDIIATRSRSAAHRLQFAYLIDIAETSATDPVQISIREPIPEPLTVEEEPEPYRTRESLLPIFISFDATHTASVKHFLTIANHALRTQNPPKICGLCKFFNLDSLTCCDKHHRHCQTATNACEDFEFRTPGE